VCVFQRVSERHPPGAKGGNAFKAEDRELVFKADDDEDRDGASGAKAAVIAHRRE